MATNKTATETFRSARDLLQTYRDDYQRAVTEFRWPDLTHFNFGFDWFDVLAAEQPTVDALWIVHGDGSEDRLTWRPLTIDDAPALTAAYALVEAADRTGELI